MDELGRVIHDRNEVRPLRRLNLLVVRDLRIREPRVCWVRGSACGARHAPSLGSVSARHVSSTISSRCPEGITVRSVPLIARAELRLDCLK